MASIATGSGFRSRKARKTLILAVAITFLALGVDSTGAFGQFPGSATPPAPKQLPSQERFPSEPPTGFPRRSQKRKKALMDYNFSKLKQHSHELAELAKSLQAEIDKSNENVLSLEIIKKAEEAEKLAKKIKNEAKGF